MLALAILALAPVTPDLPNREPRIAVSGHTVALTFGSGNGLYVATSSDDGRTFGKPVQVGGAPVVPLTRHRGPRIVFAKGALVVTAVVGRREAAGTHAHGLPADGDLLAWRSADNGRTWSKPVAVNDVPGASREGLHTLAVRATGELFAAWLDLRGPGTRLYGATSADGGSTWSKNALVYEAPGGTICQCCHPTAAFDNAGALEVMWRNVMDGARDLYLMRAPDGRHFGKAEKLGQGTWKIEGCPMDGGDLVHSGKSTISVWRRHDELFAAEPGKPEVRIGVGKDVAAAVGKNGLSVIYIREGKAWLWNAGTERELGPNAAFPALAALADGTLIAAWEREGSIAITRAGVPE